MKKRLLLAASSVLLSTPTYAAPPIMMSPALKRDVQCFVLFAIAVDGAESSNDEKMKQAGSLGMMYFLGKIRVSDPDLDFVEAVRQEANAMDVVPPTEEFGEDCDAEIQTRGAELIDLGQQLQQVLPHSSSSS